MSKQWKSLNTIPLLRKSRHSKFWKQGIIIKEHNHLNSLTLCLFLYYKLSFVQYSQCFTIARILRLNEKKNLLLSFILPLDFEITLKFLGALVLSQRKSIFASQKHNAAWTHKQGMIYFDDRTLDKAFVISQTLSISVTVISTFYQSFLYE